MRFDEAHEAQYYLACIELTLRGVYDEHWSDMG